MKLIDADTLKYKFEKRKDKVTSYEFIEALCEAQIEVDLAPTVEAVQVVRCGQCRYFRTAKCTSREDGWFCADGKRKNDA